MNAWNLAAVVALVAVALVAFSGGGARTAYAVPVLDEHCGNDVIQVPDSGPSFNFSTACSLHDECYALGGSESDRKACDDGFLADMRASCMEMWPAFSIGRARCMTVAWTYYLGVRLGGFLFFPYGA